MLAGPAAGLPSECPFRLPDRMLVDAGEPALHQTIGHKIPNSHCRRHGSNYRYRRGIRRHIARRCDHFRSRNACVTARRRGNSAQLRQSVGSVWAKATRAGSRLFHPSSARRTFSLANSPVTGGNGGRDRAHFLSTPVDASQRSGGARSRVSARQFRFA